MFKYKKNYYSKRHIAINPPQNTLPASNTLIPSFLPLSEAGLDVLFPECLYWHCRGCLDVLNRFKTFTFHGHFDFGEEPDPVNKVDEDTP